MRTALLLLLLVAFASVAGSLLPQIPVSPQRVTRYLIDHPFSGEVFLRTGLFDVFGSWWFTFLTTLLFVSLVACLLPRSRAHLRAIRTRPAQVRELDGFRHHRQLVVRAAPAPAAEAARRALRRRRWRVERADDGLALAAEKGILREAGSLVFHWAFVLLLVGVVVGKGTGYSGRATVPEGETWADAAANYDPGTLRTGRFAGSHTGVQIELLRFESAFRDSGVPMDFVSTVELFHRDGSSGGVHEVRVNHPVVFDGLRIFQYGFGWAPSVRIEDDGEPLVDGPVVMGQADAPEGVSQLAMPWLGFVKLPSLEPQMAVRLELWPDSAAYVRSVETGVPQPMVGTNAPFMRYRVYEGVLRDPSLASLDTRLMDRVGSGVIGAGQTVELTSEVEMTFTELPRYSVLQVSRDVGVPVVLAAAILIVLGLLPALYVSRRRLWVRIRPHELGAELEVAGFSLQGKARFEGEFAKAVEALVAAAGGEDVSARETVGAG
jgi:cytochrome c biogenesis protein